MGSPATVDTSNLFAGRRRPGARTGQRLAQLLVMGLVCVFTATCGGTSYRERYIIVFKETRFPCLGVSRLKIEVSGEGLTAIQREYVKPTFWRITDGKCDLPDGLVIKEIPFGGVRKVTLIGYDSADLPVAEGNTVPFEVQPEGDVQDTIELPFKRLDSVAEGTLVLTFKGGLQALHDSTKTLVLVIPMGSGGDYKRVVPVVQVKDLQLPLVIPDIPSAASKKFTLVAQDGAGKQLQRWQGIYTISNPKKANEWVDQVELVL